MANGSVGRMLLVGGGSCSGLQRQGGGIGAEGNVAKAVCSILFSYDYDLAVFVEFDGIFGKEGDAVVVA
jgi:hypothetical protein